MFFSICELEKLANNYIQIMLQSKSNSIKTDVFIRQQEEIQNVHFIYKDLLIPYIKTELYSMKTQKRLLQSFLNLIRKNSLRPIDSEQIISSINFYAVSLKETSYSDDLLEHMYLTMWKIAYLDATRELLYQHIQKQYPFALISKSIAPGFNEIPLYTIPYFYYMVKPDKSKLSYNKKFVLIPGQSCIGAFLVLEQTTEQIRKENPCTSCLQQDVDCFLCSFHYKKSST